ncbi:MAG: hypothetical protein U1F43_04315 [Myxococcota bacterium]
MLVGIVAGCGGGAGAPATIDADAVADGDADATATDDADATTSDDADALDDGDATLDDAEVASEVVDSSTGLELPGDRNCEYDPRYGNARDPELRCAPCRSMVGIVGDKIQVVLLWEASYDSPVSAPALCDAYPDSDCHAEVVAAEVMLCKNLGSGKTRILWNDIADVSIGTGAEARTGEARGPSGGLLLGDVRLFSSGDVPFETAPPAFVPAQWAVRTKAGDLARIAVDEGRHPEQCPVGKITVAGNPTRIGVIAPCSKAFQAFGGD